MTEKLFVALLLPIFNLSAQMMVKYLLSGERREAILAAQGAQFVWQLLSIPGVWLVAGFQFCSFVLWGYVISRMQLGVANALAGSFYYLLSGVAGMVIFGELLTSRQWIGIACISVGAMFLIIEG